MSAHTLEVSCSPAWLPQRVRALPASLACPAPAHARARIGRRPRRRAVPAGGPREVKPNPARIEAATAALRSKTTVTGDVAPEAAACIRPCPPDASPMIGKAPPSPLGRRAFRWVMLTMAEARREG